MGVVASVTQSFPAVWASPTACSEAMESITALDCLVGHVEHHRAGKTGAGGMWTAGCSTVAGIVS